MTLIAGFTGYAGVILCADSQETVGSYQKKSVSKIQQLSNDNFGFACAGAGHGPYIDMVTQQLMWEIEKQGANPDFGPSEATEIIQRIIADYYKQHVWPRGSHSENTEVELLAVLGGIGMGGPYLFHTCETAVNWIQGGHKCIGVGGYLAEYLCDHLYTSHGDTYHMLAVAAYILKKARDYIEGCGKESEIYLFERGHSKRTVWLDHEEMGELETALQEFDVATRTMFHVVTDINSSTLPSDGKEQARKAFSKVENRIRKMVESHERKEAEYRAMVERWGSKRLEASTTPSTAQKKPDQQ